MSGIYWDKEDVHLKTYSANSRSSGETVFRIELATSDPYEVSRILRQLAEITTEQKPSAAARQKPGRARRQPGNAAQAIEGVQPPLQLTYREDD